MNLKISGRLILSFGVMSAILIATIAITMYEVSKMNAISNRVIQLRMPTASASSAMVNDINASLAALRGYMLTGSSSFKAARADVWADIDKVSANMDALAENWTNPKNVENWTQLKEVLAEFRAAQAKVEAIAKTPDEQPATKLLVTEAAPRAGAMVKLITKMIDLEIQGKGASTGNRVDILGMMADTRGSLGLGLASIRAYLLTGDQKFADSFTKLWAKNTARFADLGKQLDNLSVDQLVAFHDFATARKEFAPLPPKMFAIRGSEKWNMANYTLITEAAPRAEKLLDTLTGVKDENGVRQGGMARNQADLLKMDADKSSAAVLELELIIWTLLAIGIAAAVITILLSIRSIVKPIKEMTLTMGELASGNLQAEIPAQDKTDEVGEMAQAVQVFKDNALKVIQMEEEQAERARLREIEATRAMNELADNFERSVGTVVDTVSSASTELQSSAQAMSATAEHADTQASNVASASEQAAANVETVATAAEELSASINEISRQVQESSRVTATAVDEANSADNMVQSLATAANKIGEVVSLITDIAEQTNLLALNATIEAARAGDAGKGFAVVASEVKNLANQTAKATEEISQQITGIQDASNNAVGAIQRIGSTIDNINQISSTIAAAVEEQGAATQEIARAVEQAATGTTEVSANISTVNEAATNAGSAANNVLNSAGSLSEQSNSLRSQVETFLGEIKAA